MSASSSSQRITASSWIPAPPSVTAIIATVAEAKRRDSLMRAVHSLYAATRRCRLTITAVVNGSRFVPEVLSDLAARNVRIVQIPEGSLPAALLAGRRSVASDYFCFLDDDDEYLPDAIDRRLEALERAPSSALVASNGYRHIGGTDTLVLERLSEVPHNALNILFQENWLPSCGGLFRTRLVGVESFEGLQEYLEWTWLAFRIVLSGGSIAALDEPTFRIHDSPSSLSKAPAGLSSRITLYHRMLGEKLPLELRKTIQKRLAIAFSMQSVASLKANDLSAAWKYHLSTLGSPGGWRYSSQTLRLIAASLKRSLTSEEPSR